MKINCKSMLAHLSKIGVRGHVKEAVFSKSFETVALTPDRLLLVLAPALKGAKKLTEEVGLPDLTKFSRALNTLGGDDVDLEFTDGRIVLTGGERDGVLRLLTAAPKTIATVAEDDVVKKVLSGVPTGDGMALDPELVAMLLETFSMLGADEVEVTVGKKGGKIRVGSENADVAEFESETLVTDGEEYSLLFGKHLLDVLSVVDPEETRLKLGGTKGYALIEDGGYRYIMSSRSRGAD